MQGSREESRSSRKGSLHSLPGDRELEMTENGLVIPLFVKPLKYGVHLKVTKLFT